MRCYCCSNLPFSSCCEPFLKGQAKPQTAAQLMRSRFSAYASKQFEYVLATYTKERQPELSVDELINMARIIDDNPLKDNPQKGTELFDVVDENDQVLGQKERAHVHAECLLHRAVHVFVFNKSGDLYLQKRSMRFYGISTIPGFSQQHFNRSTTFYVKNILIRGVYVEVGGYLNQHHY